MKNEIALFSGRFDPFHLGHIITIGKILQKYKYVVVCILNFPERAACDINENINILDDFLNLWLPLDRTRIEIIVNNTHFAKIAKNELKDILKYAFNHDNLKECTYVGGNRKVNKHIKSLKCIDVEHFPRQYFYRASDIRKGIKHNFSR